MMFMKAVSKDGEILCESKGAEEVILYVQAEYQEGDRIILILEEENQHVFWQVDDAIGQAFLYMKEKKAEYQIPFGEKRISYSPKAFFGGQHYLTARLAKEYEIREYRNLALNAADQHEAKGYFPHVSANVETRGEAVFAARNAIDGVKANSSHGNWPYESWGINRQDDARMKLDFGRTVSIDQVVLYTRADFPHDNWWKQATIEFSDGSSETLLMEKSSLPHKFMISERKVEWLILKELIKSDDPSFFPALTQIEVYGKVQ